MTIALPLEYSLRELQAKFVKKTAKGFREVKDIKKAQGIWYLCPVHFHINKGDVGTHYMLHWFNNVGIDAALDPGPGRWNATGTGIDDLTFVGPGAYSVMAIGHWHGFIEKGRVRVDQIISES